MTTGQLTIVCLTVLAIALIVAYVRRQEDKARMRQVEIEASDRVRRAEWPEPPSLTPAPGSVLAVHFDGRVVQGTLEKANAATFVLTDANAVSGASLQPLGGKQYISRSLVTQTQEL